MNLTRTLSFALALTGLLALLVACEPNQPAPPANPGAGGNQNPANNKQAQGHGHGGAVVDLGTATIGPFSVKATRDEGDLTPGGEAPIDVTVTPASEAGARVAAVRFWIGAEDGSGSVKARAEVEDPADPDRWHTHADIPRPLPEGSRLWVEIEDDKGATHTGSFPL